jgi:hypothetical protein
MGYDTDTYGTRVLLNTKRKKTFFIANSSPAPSSLPYLDDRFEFFLGERVSQTVTPQS